MRIRIFSAIGAATIGTTLFVGASISVAEELAASANLVATSSSKVAGSVRFEPGAKGVSITGEITGLTPGEHGLHIHQVGDCSAADASSAGPHFNPAGSKHGDPKGHEHHAGDLGNLVADKDGVAKLQIVDSSFALAGENSIIGRAIVVHEKADDLKTDPAGNSGARIGCGVISHAK